MSAPAQADWTTDVDWTEQCKGIDWGRHPEPTEEEKAVATHQPVGHPPAHMKYPAFSGIAFIDVEEKKSQERQLAKEATVASGHAMPGRWDHAERHKNHSQRFQDGQNVRTEFMRELTVHLVCRPEWQYELRKMCEQSRMVCLNDGNNTMGQGSEKFHVTPQSDHSVTFCGGLHELQDFFQGLSPAWRSKLRCESSDFTLLSAFPGMLRPLNGGAVAYNETNNGTRDTDENEQYALPVAPQRRTVYNRSSLCRIREPMKLVDADYGRSDTVWIRVLSNNDATMLSRSQRRTKDELSREAGVWTRPHKPTKVYVPPPKPNVVEMGRGASTSSTKSFLPSPPRRSKPSGDIKHYLLKNATKWKNGAEAQKAEEKAIKKQLEEYLHRNKTPTSKYAESPAGLKAAFDRKQLATKNQQDIDRAVALRRWREARIEDLQLVIGGIDLTSVPNTVLARCRQIAQHGVHRVYDRHLRKRPLSAKLPTPVRKSDEGEEGILQPLADGVLLDEFNRRMRIVCNGRSDADTPEVLEVLLEPVDPVTEETLLHIACKYERVVHVKVLLALNEVDVNCTEATQSKTPLHVAATVGNAEIVQLLLEKRASDLNVDSLDNQDWTPLHVAAHFGHTTVVQLLLPRSGCKGKLQTTAGDSPLHLASAAGNDATVVEMLMFHYKGSSLSGNTLPPMQHAKEPELESTLEPEPSISTDLTEDGIFNTGIHVLHVENKKEGSSEDDNVNDNNKRKAAPRFESNCDVLRLTNNQGCTPLHVAAANGHLSVVKRLASSPSPVPTGGVRLLMVRDEEGHLPAMHAVLGVEGKNVCNETAIFLWEELISKRFRRVPKGDALRLFELAVRSANDVLVRHFCTDVEGIENAIGVEKEEDGEGPAWSCVHLAAHYGFSHVLAAMAAVGNADMNLQDKDMMRPLDLACMAGHRLTSIVLLDAGGVIGEETLSKRAKKLWSLARTTITGSIRSGVVEQERLIKTVARCDEDLVQAIGTRNAPAIIDATDAYQEAKLALKDYREFFLEGER